MKIKVEYEIPDGEYCLKQFENKAEIKPCKYYYDHEHYCTLFGMCPIRISEGHLLARRKLYACTRAEVSIPPDPLPPDSPPNPPEKGV